MQQQSLSGVLGEDVQGTQNLNKGTVEFYKDHETVEKIKVMKEEYKINSVKVKKMESE